MQVSFKFRMKDRFDVILTITTSNIIARRQLIDLTGRWEERDGVMVWTTSGRTSVGWMIEWLKGKALTADQRVQMKQVEAILKEWGRLRRGDDRGKLLLSEKMRRWNDENCVSGRRVGDSAEPISLKGIT